MSIGTSLYPNDASSPEMLLKCADEAMYKAKHSGKNKISYYQDDTSQYCLTQGETNTQQIDSTFSI
jgi:predicted signal transduction protein with EAL and GGDEF domain